MDFVRDGAFDATHTVEVQQTLAELQQMVKEHETALNKLREHCSVGPMRPEVSLEIMKAAYDELSVKTPFLPFPESVLPALVALRKTHQTVEDSRAYLASHGDTVERSKRQLEVERSSLNDQLALSQGLRNRIQSLRDGLDSRMDMDSDGIAQERITELKRKKKVYDKDTSKLLKALRKFIDDHLASMLAAEELGGPVVGDLMGIDGDNLAGGFSSQGKPKKVKENQNQDSRQRRIDDIWGQRTGPQSIQDGGADWDESAAAGSEMKDLTEELLNSLVGSDGDNTAAYVQLDKETAAARFLVRCKVAQFHPKDSTRLRLVDFGRELDE